MSTGTAFVYGTLMAPEVVSVLLRRVPPMKPATLKGYTRYRVKGVVFPAIVSDAADGAEVRGQVLLNLTKKELDILDAYESVEYERKTVEPFLEDGSVITADVYVWKEEYSLFRDLHDMHGKFPYEDACNRPSLEPLAWDYEDFRTQHLAAYTVSTEEYMKETEEAQAA